MDDKALDGLVVRLASGRGEAAFRYLQHFPKVDRRPALVRRSLAARVLPEIMATFERIAPWLADDGPDDLAERLRRALAEAGRLGHTRSTIGQRMRRDDTEAVQAALERLEASREVVLEERATGGRPALVYRLAEHAEGVEPVNENADPFAFRPSRD